MAAPYSKREPKKNKFLLNYEDEEALNSGDPKPEFKREGRWAANSNLQFGLLRTHPLSELW